jgi:peptide/nickel transport system permease protein
MLRFLARRFAAHALLTAVAAVAGYVLASMTLDPAARFAGRTPPVPRAVVEAQLATWGADPAVPLPRRTWAWLVGIVTRGDLGLSTRGQPVVSEIAARAGTSLRLLLLGTALGVLLGIAVGLWGAVRQYRWPDRVTSVVSYVLLAMPPFVIAVCLMTIATWLNRVAGSTVIPFTGEYTPGLAGGFWTLAGDRAAHLLLPTLALALAGAASFSRYQRSAALDVLSAEHVRTARALGYTRRQAVLRHGVRVALAPMSTFVAYSFGLVLAGATVTELAFSWHGMGEYLVTSIAQNDVNAAAATVLFNAVLVLVAGTLADVLHAALDPRVRA